MILWHCGQRLQVDKLLSNSPVEDIHIKKEMGYSQFEFINQFKNFAKELNYSMSKSTIKLTDANDSSQLTINLTELTDRVIGSLKISRLEVLFYFKNYTPLQHQKFLKKFDLSFQRGGG